MEDRILRSLRCDRTSHFFGVPRDINTVITKYLYPPQTIGSTRCHPFWFWVDAVDLTGKRFQICVDSKATGEELKIALQQKTIMYPRALIFAGKEIPDTCKPANTIFPGMTIHICY